VWQVISLGSGRMRVVDARTGTPQRLYRTPAGDPNTPSRSTLISQSGNSGPLSFRSSDSGAERVLLSPDAAPRVVSYRIHPVRSETDFGRPSAPPAAVYSSEWHSPVSQYHDAPDRCPSNAGGQTTAANNDQYVRFVASSVLVTFITVYNKQDSV